jgi:serine/threonine-protein kinase
MNSRDLRDLRGESDAPTADTEGGDALIGQLIAERYRVVRKLGEGAQASVYIAKHTLIKRYVALKILQPATTADRSLVRRFLDEGQIAGTIGHPNIVESLDMGATEDGRPFLVLEYLEGTTLGAELSVKGSFDVGRSAYVAMQIASALEAAHERGIVHRDLKPENVFLVVREGRSDHVKVIDFGISKFQNRSEADPQAGHVFGTPEYMAPEQVTSPATVDERADVFALGAMLYEMLSGRTPLDVADSEDVLEAIVRRVPASLSKVNPGLPLPLVAAVERAMRKDRTQRYAHVADFRAAVAPFAIAPAPGAGSLSMLSYADSAARDSSAGLRSSRVAPVPPMRVPSFPGDRDSDPGASSSVAGAHPHAPAPAPAPAPATKAKPAVIVALGAAVLLAIVGLVMGRAALEARRAQHDATPVATAVGPTSTASPGSASTTVSATGTQAPEATPPPSARDPHELASATAFGTSMRPDSKVVVVVAGASSAGALNSAKRRALDVAAAPGTTSSATAPAVTEAPATPEPVVIATAATPVTTAAAPAAPTVAPGTVTPREVGATVRAHAAEVQGCFDRARMNSPELRGRVVVRAGVDPTGRVTGASVGSTTANDTRLESCLVGAFNRWTFPAPSGGVAGTVTYTFIFE